MAVWNVLPLGDSDDPKKGVRVIRQAWNGEPFLSGSVVDIGVTSGSAEFTVRHKLGRVPAGYVVEWLEMAGGATSGCSIYYRAGATRTVDDLTLYTTGSFTLARIRVY
jgi:hypothetical protein